MQTKLRQSYVEGESPIKIGRYAVRTSRCTCYLARSLLVLVILFMFLVGNRAFPWGVEGHQAVGELARGLLTNTARQKINAILSNDDLAAVSIWADEVRQAGKRHSGPLVHDPETIKFNQDFPNNDKWHFVNLPLAMPEYTDNGDFSSPEDVVHAINSCIDVLENKSTRFTRIQALRMLVHFVGDVHQPLHVGTGYFSFDNKNMAHLIVDPVQARGESDDRGGNDLFYSKSGELHAYWDAQLVSKIDKTTDAPTLAAFLKNHVDAVTWKDTGDHHQWAEKWASESAHEAQAAYQGIKFGAATFKGVQHPTLDRIQIKLPKAYLAQQSDRATQQLAKAGFHLAELLNNLQWP
ncbi:MAG TPA: S1/P1 nuclease [Terriglobales bacterium]|nr:S1/P1 nuclease [Terriglobales bacterium]